MSNLQEYKKILLVSGSRTWRISWQRSTLPSRRGRKARKPRFGFSFSPFGGLSKKNNCHLNVTSAFHFCSFLQAVKIKANEAKLHAADEKKSKVLADVKDKV